MFRTISVRVIGFYCSLGYWAGRYANSKTGFLAVRIIIPEELRMLDESSNVSIHNIDTTYTFTYW